MIAQDKTYRHGQEVPLTGLYRVFHYQHRLPHDVVMRQGETFPPCNKCGERVTFTISTSAETLSNDRDFAVEAA